MSDTEQQIEWFLGREGKQYGPISDIEMRKVVEFGHLRATDLLWKQGFADWTPALQVFPPPPPPPAPVPPPQQPSHRRGEQPTNSAPHTHPVNPRAGATEARGGQP